MTQPFARGSLALGLCDVCGFQFRLNTLRRNVVNQQVTNVLACGRCWERDHPQYRVGKMPVIDPQALRNPRPDNPDRTIVVNQDAVDLKII